MKLFNSTYPQIFHGYSFLQKKTKKLSFGKNIIFNEEISIMFYQPTYIYPSDKLRQLKKMYDSFSAFSTNTEI